MRPTTLQTIVIFLLVVLCFIFGCSPDNRPNVLAMGDWITHGFSEEQRDELRSFFKESVKNESVAGCALLLIHEDEVVFKEAFGLADMESGRPFTTENPCFIASLTKSLTSTLMVMLDELGILSMDDPVETWIPSFKGVTVRGQAVPARPPRVWECLSHRSGLPGNGDLDRRNLRDFEGTLSEVVDHFAAAGLMAEPGTRWSYGKVGFMTAARAAEIATNQKFETLLQDLVLNPLGMASTTFHPSAEALEAAPRAYQQTGDGLVRRPGVHPVTKIGDLINPGGGLFSTMDDMGRFLRFHLNKGVVNGKRLVSEDALARMYRVPREIPEHSYGLGLNVTEKGVRHLGGSGTMLWIDFDRQLAGLLLTQTTWKGNQRFQRNFNALLRRVFEE